MANELWDTLISNFGLEMVNEMRGVIEDAGERAIGLHHEVVDFVNSHENQYSCGQWLVALGLVLSQIMLEVEDDEERIGDALSILISACMAMARGEDISGWPLLPGLPGFNPN